ncbi:TetR/AcrR family transcriptional regulator [Pseudohoeflea coraliihabitans]|uniref:TetR/AcrR family transcriptional regulator n=1 Tax=Pseudohoeflea coraliihabitans TaxID=2860393 RepID=A0ABS6WRM1_9HYPH|nr:TetR/AcrR family transcriptional regulator [Pseudohoeflea sp. DP4N28-3]MBW3098435.1 TetR/AcrR family transcriptional regulator [Pseudohoeflea sp. DP4N28-3]
MRDRIKSVAEELLIKHGYRGLSFRQISELLNTTRANLHYHFGSKDGLVEEVLEDYANRTLDGYRDILTDSRTTLRQKVEAVVRATHARYKTYNTGGDEGEPWSLMIRLRSDSDAITPKMRAKLRDVSREFETLVRVGVRAAIQSGELRPDTPEDQVVVMLVNIIHYAGSVTRDHGTFQRLADLWESTLTTIEKAYGNS